LVKLGMREGGGGGLNLMSQAYQNTKGSPWTAKLREKKSCSRKKKACKRKGPEGPWDIYKRRKRESLGSKQAPWVEESYTHKLKGGKRQFLLKGRLGCKWQWTKRASREACWVGYNSSGYRQRKGPESARIRDRDQQSHSEGSTKKSYDREGGNSLPLQKKTKREESRRDYGGGGKGRTHARVYKKGGL